MARKKSTRRGKITLEQSELIRRIIRQNPFVSLEELRTRIGLRVCITTISKHIKRVLGLTKRVSPVKFDFDDNVREDRLRWARVRHNLGSEFWSRVVFCDETGIDNSGKLRRLVFRRRGQRYNRRLIYRHANPSLKINMFTWVTSNGPGRIYIYKRMNSTVYCQVISGMIAKLRETMGENFLIIHDNAAFAKSVQTYAFMRDHDYLKYFLPMPTYSPDINIIENMFGWLKYRVREHCFLFRQTRERAQFRRLVSLKWLSIARKNIRNLYQSLPTRMRAIVEANGGPTKY